MARFTSFRRMTVRIRVDLAHGVGGAVTCVRLTPDPAKAARLAAWLKTEALPAAIRRPGMVGGFTGVNDLDVANAPGKAQGGTYPVVEDVEWAVVLEGADAHATSTAARAALPRRALADFGVTAAPTVGTYTLLFGNER